MPERKKFLEIFQENADSSLTPKQSIEINGIRFGPGVTFQKGVAFGGIDFQLFKYRDIQVEPQADGSLKIIGFYNN